MENISNNRIYFKMELEVSDIFNQKQLNEHINMDLDVIDISKTGVAFEADYDLPVNYFFNSKISRDDDSSLLQCIVKIIKKISNNGRNLYGCEFVGITSVFEQIFEHNMD